MFAGLSGMATAWRRLGGPTLLTGVVLLVYPAATAGFSSRYVVASIPALSIAAALAAKQVSDHSRATAERARYQYVRPLAHH
jgi:hypothetical protein